MRASTGVVVAGAGPSGLLCALELARRGIACRVFDRRPRVPGGGTRCPTVWQRSREVLERAGVRLEDAEGGFLTLRRKRFHIGGETAAIDVSTDRAPFAEPVLIAQERLERLLTRRLAELGTPVEYATEVVRTADHGWGVTASVHGPAGEAGVGAEWLVDTTGRAGPLCSKGSFGFAAERTYPGAEWFLADVRVADASITTDEEHIYRFESGHAGLIPIPGRLHRLFLAVGAGTGPTARSAARRASEVTGLPIASVEGSTWRVRAHGSVADRWRSGRIVLAGDAAKRLPMPVHGLNSGLQDAAALGWMLADAIRHGDAGLLAEYERERRSAALALFERTDRVFGYGSRTGISELRDRLLKRVVDMRTEPEVRHPAGRLVDGGAGECGLTGGPLPAVALATGAPSLFELVRATTGWTAVVLCDPADGTGARRELTLRSALDAEFPGRVRVV
ncbi:FAD-dependent monooxygenase, partial [Streptomonospora algeriensis]